MLNKTFAVVDLETTGNNLKKDNIIQLSIVFVRNFEITGQYNTFLSDEVNVSPFIRELTNISPDMLIGAPKFRDLAADIKDKLKDAVFVAHNVDVDLNFLKTNCNTSAFTFTGTVHSITLAPAFLAAPAVSSVQLLGTTYTSYNLSG